jgi:mono/diheme cytochrome c family protein
MSETHESFDASADDAPEEDIHDLHDPIMRERARPRDGYQPIPLTLIFLFFGLLLWGGWYMGAYSGGGRVDVFYPGQQTTAEKAASADDTNGESASPEELASLGKRVYAQCSACHQNNGQGVAGSFPPLDGSRWVTGNPEVPIRILLHGMQGPVEVEGNTYNGAMPAWGGQLSDRQIAGVLTYVRSAWSNEASAIEPSQVEKVRGETGDRTSPWTASELEGL